MDPQAPTQKPEPLARQDERVGPPRYLVLSTPHGWQLLLEHGDRYVRWELRGAPGNGGQATPGTDVAAASLETQSGALAGKPALEREGHETGHFVNLRARRGETVAMSQCLDEGELELEFDGELMAGRWRLTRSGTSPGRPEHWVLRPAPSP